MSVVPICELHVRHTGIKLFGAVMPPFFSAIIWPYSQSQTLILFIWQQGQREETDSPMYFVHERCLYCFGIGCFLYFWCFASFGAGLHFNAKLCFWRMRIIARILYKGLEINAVVVFFSNMMDKINGIIYIVLQRHNNVQINRCKICINFHQFSCFLSPPLRKSHANVYIFLFNALARGDREFLSLLPRFILFFLLRSHACSRNSGFFV